MSVLRRVLVLVVSSVLGAAAAGPAGAATVRFSNTPVASWRPNGVGQAVLVVGNTVYVGGSFSSVRSPNGSSSVSRANLAAFDATTGALLTAFRADTNGTVRALATDGNRLFVGGSFTRVNGTYRGRVAAVDLASGAVQSFSADASSNVYALAVGGGRLYLGGSFSSVRGQSRSRLAAVDPASGALSSFNASANNSVRALAASADGSHLYAGGDFSQINGSSRPYLVRLNSSGGIVSTGWSRTEAPVFALSLRPDTTRLAVAYAGTVNSSAYYNTSSGARLWAQRCEGDTQGVWIVEDSVFAGHHEGCQGDFSVRLASWNAANGARDTGFRPTFDRFWGVWGINGNSSVLAIAGDFTRISGVSVQGFALFRR